jgi:hypothetical protein
MSPVVSQPCAANSTARRDEPKLKDPIRTVRSPTARAAGSAPCCRRNARAVCVCTRCQAGGQRKRHAASLRSLLAHRYVGCVHGQPARAHVHCICSGHKMRPNLFGSRSPSPSSARAALAPSGLRNHAHSPPRACRPQRDAPPSTTMPGAEVSITSRFSLRVPMLSMSRWSGSSPPGRVSASRDRRRVPLYGSAKPCDRVTEGTKGAIQDLVCCAWPVWRSTAPEPGCRHHHYRLPVNLPLPAPDVVAIVCLEFIVLWLHNCPPHGYKNARRALPNPGESRSDPGRLQALTNGWPAKSALILTSPLIIRPTAILTLPAE